MEKYVELSSIGGNKAIVHLKELEFKQILSTIRQQRKSN